MKKSILFILALAFWSCEDDGPIDEGPEVTVTSFSGTIVFEDMQPLTNGELTIVGIESSLFGGRTVDGTMLPIDDGTFDFTFENLEPITRFNVIVRVIQDGFLVNTFGFVDGLECIPGNCGDFPSGQDHEFTIVVPCTEDDCVRFDPG